MIKLRFTMATAVLLACKTGALAQVHVLSATDVITKRANYFDLEGRTLRYTPSSGGYRVENIPATFQNPGSAAQILGNAGRTQASYSISWAVQLPFAFPFSGRTYNSLFVNVNGNISFDTPETASLPNSRNPWPDGTVRGAAAAIDGRSLGGSERMISAYWNLFQLTTGSRVQTEVLSGNRFAVTWNVERSRSANTGYTPLGRNVFQAILYQSGQIDLTYQTISEKDGIVGLFPGVASTATGTRLDNVERPNTTAEPVVAVRNLELTDLGSALRWRFTMGAPTPATIPPGQSLWYRVFLTLSGQNCEISLGYEPNVRTVLTCGGVGGSALAYRNENGTVDLIAPKLALNGATSFSWGSDVVWFGIPGRFDQVNLSNRRPVQMSSSQAIPEIDLSALPASAATARFGNLYEIFHYTAVDKNLLAAPRVAYRSFAPADDFFVPMLDFRPDDLFNHGPSTGQLPTGPRVTNIGNNASGSGSDIGSRQAQVAISPLYFKGQRLAEWVNDGRRDYFNYAQAVAWIAHEITHRWTAFLSFRDPSGGNVPIASGSHWLPELNVPAVHKIWQDYSFSEYPERSIMDGGIYEELPNGRFRQLELTYIIPAGFTGVDLYAMGLMSAEQMPDTFLIRNRQASGPNEFTGTKVAVRGSDIVAAMGPRSPSAENSQKEFVLGVYLFHDPDAPGPDPEVLSEARQITLQTMNFFSRASGGRMTVTASGPMEVPLPVLETVQNAAGEDMPISEGSIVTITGSALAVKETAAKDFVPQWNGTSVTVGGVAAMVRQVSPQSLEVKIPAGVAGDEVNLEVTTRRGTSEPLKLKIASFPKATRADR